MFLCVALRCKVRALTYSVSWLVNLISPIGIAYLNCDHQQDLRCKVRALTYSVSQLIVLILPIGIAYLTRDCQQDLRLIGQYLKNEKDLFVCLKGTTCCELHLLRFSSLFAEPMEHMTPVAMKVLESKIMNEEDDMDTFFTGVKDINEQLISPGEVISYSSLVHTIFDALPDSYQTFASTWRLVNQRNPEVIKFDKVCTLLLQEALSKKKGLDTVQLNRLLLLLKEKVVTVMQPLLMVLLRVENHMFLMLLLAVIHLKILERLSSSRRPAKMISIKIIAVAVAVGNLLNGWDSATLAGALLYIEPEFNLDVQPVLEGAVAAASLIGAALSTTFAGSGADWLGRRKMLCISAALYCIGSLLMVWSPNVYLLLAARIVDGVGVGLAVTVAPLYISEVSPAEIRGELNTLPQLLGTMGMFLAYCMVFGISLTTSPNWRMMLGLMLIPACIYLVLGLFFLPESPRWLVSKGKTKEAKEVLQRLRNKKDVSGEMALLVEGLGVGENPVLEEYVIQPADFLEDDSLNLKDDNHVTFFTPNDGNAWIAKPISSFPGSQSGFLSRPASVTHQGTPTVVSRAPLMDSTVTLMGSVTGSFVDHFHGLISSHTLENQVEAIGDLKEDEEMGNRMREANGYHSDVSDVDADLTSPLLSSPLLSRNSEHWDDTDLHRGDSFRSYKAAPEGIVGSFGSVGVGNGWYLAFQWTGPEGTEGKPDHGSYKRVYLYQEPQMAGTGMGSSSSLPLPRFGSTVGEVESIPAAAIVSWPSQCGKGIVADNPVGLALVHPAETATKGPAWSELLEGGVKQALIVGVTLQVLEQFGGINAVLNFTPKILQESGTEVLLSQMGIGSDSASILASAATSLVALPFIVVSMRLMDIAGRRKILLHALPVLVVTLLCLIIVNLVPTSEAVFATVSVLSVVVYVIFFMAGFGPIPNMICAEIFPTRVRGVCIAICQAAMWITNILVTELFPILDSTLGIANTFAIFAAFCFITWIFVYFKVPETKGLPLEIIVEFFALSAAEKKKPAVTLENEGDVPLQPESHSCGWRVVTDAQLLIDFIYCNEDGDVDINRDCYSENHLWLIRERLIKYMIETNGPLQDVFKDDDDVEVLSKEEQENVGQKTKQPSIPTRRSPRSKSPLQDDDDADYDVADDDDDEEQDKRVELEVGLVVKMLLAIEGPWEKGELLEMMVLEIVELLEMEEEEEIWEGIVK
ncbi:hypothetical protein L7F22_017813 [Adiantum nelumboides]|nr:hypothetical protein [Adiantum nelumboides]